MIFGRRGYYCCDASHFFAREKLKNDGVYTSDSKLIVTFAATSIVHNGLEG